MTFKVGDWVVVVGSKNQTMSLHIGKVGRIYGRSPISLGWYVENADFAANGIRCAWGDRHLRLIDPPAEGETIGAYKNLKVPA